MEKEARLPQNKKDFIIFLGTISIISVNIIAPLIMASQFGFSREVYFQTLKVIPFMWLAVMILVPIVSEPFANKFVSKFVEPSDGFNARILFHTLFSVIILSIILTILGSWIGQRKMTLEPFYHFFSNWPRNFFIAFWVEILIAQPIARFVMKKIHA